MKKKQKMKRRRRLHAQKQEKKLISSSFSLLCLSLPLSCSLTTATNSLSLYIYISILHAPSSSSSSSSSSSKASTGTPYSLTTGLPDSLTRRYLPSARRIARSITACAMPQQPSGESAMLAASSRVLNVCAPRTECADASRGCERETNPSLTKSTPLTRADAAQRASLGALFFSSVAKTAPRCASSLARQSTPVSFGSYSVRARTATSLVCGCG